MLTSKPIPAEAGAKLGLVDAVVSSAQLLDTACQLALGIASGVKPRNQVKPSLEHHRSFGSGSALLMHGSLAFVQQALALPSNQMTYWKLALALCTAFGHSSLFSSRNA